MDWNADAQPTEEEAYGKLIGRIHPGAIVLLHNTSSTNGKILDELLTRWEDMGYTFQRIFSKPDPVYHYCTAACNCWSCHYHYGNQTSGRQYHKTDRCIK